MAQSDIPMVPDTDGIETLLAGAKLALGLFPLIGGSLSEIVGYFGQQYISARQNVFLEDILDHLRYLATRFDDLPGRLAQDEVFYSTLCHALDVLPRTANREKINALRNAVLNAALPDAPDESIQQTFVRYVDELTVWHLSLLDCIADPLDWARRHDNYPVHTQQNMNSASVFEGKMREMLPSSEFTGVLLQDVLTRGLCTTGVNPYGPPIMNDEESTRPRITELGKRFLAFVAPPVQSEEDSELLTSPQNSAE